MEDMVQARQREKLIRLVREAPREALESAEVHRLGPELLEHARKEANADPARILPLAKFLVDLGDQLKDRCFKVQACANLMAVYTHLGNYVAAVRIYDDLVAEYGFGVRGACGLCRAYVLRSYAQWLILQGRSKAALSAISEAVDCAPRDHEVFVYCVARRANVLFMANRYDESAMDLRAVLDRLSLDAPMVRPIKHSFLVALAHGDAVARKTAIRMLPEVEKLYVGLRGHRADKARLKWLKLLLLQEKWGIMKVRRHWDSLHKSFMKLGLPVELMSVTIAGLAHMVPGKGLRMLRETLAHPCVREAPAEVVAEMRALQEELERYEEERSFPQFLMRSFQSLHERLAPHLPLKINPIEV